MISELPLFIFTVLGGLAAGSYAVVACFPKFDDKKRSWLFPLIALILIAAGGIALMFHLGRPERVFYAFLNPAAGIAQEGYATIALGVLVVIDLIICLVRKNAVYVLRVITGVVGVVLLVIMGNAYFAYDSIPALANPLTFVFFILCGLGMGAALVGIMPSKTVNRPRLCLVAGVLGLIAGVAMIVEGIYFMTCDEEIVWFIIGGIIALVGGVCAFLGGKRGTGIMAVAFICVFVGVIISRVGFYLAL